MKKKEGVIDNKLLTYNNVNFSKNNGAITFKSQIKELRKEKKRNFIDE